MLIQMVNQPLLNSLAHGLWAKLDMLTDELQVGRLQALEERQCRGMASIQEGRHLLERIVRVVLDKADTLWIARYAAKRGAWLALEASNLSRPEDEHLGHMRQVLHERPAAGLRLPVQHSGGEFCDGRAQFAIEPIQRFDKLGQFARLADSHDILPMQRYGYRMCRHDVKRQTYQRQAHLNISRRGIDVLSFSRTFYNTCEDLNGLV